MTTAGFVGRFPMAMLGLALTLLVVAETGSYARAGPSPPRSRSRALSEARSGPVSPTASASTAACPH